MTSRTHRSSMCSLVLGPQRIEGGNQRYGAERASPDCTRQNQAAQRPQNCAGSCRRPKTPEKSGEYRNGWCVRQSGASRSPDSNSHLEGNLMGIFAESANRWRRPKNKALTPQPFSPPDWQVDGYDNGKASPVQREKYLCRLGGRTPRRPDAHQRPYDRSCLVAVSSFSRPISIASRSIQSAASACPVRRSTVDITDRQCAANSTR